MKKITVKSMHLKNNGKWYPSGFVRKPIGHEEIDNKEISFPELHYDTKQEADNYLKLYFIERGYKESDIEIK